IALADTRAAWRSARPAVISSHRLNYAHLDPAWSRSGRDALRKLLAGLCREGATFFTDAEVRALVECGWSARETGARGVLLRNRGGATGPLTVAAPEGVAHAIVRDAGGRIVGEVRAEGGNAAVRAGAGAWWIEWA